MSLRGRTCALILSGVLLSATGRATGVAGTAVTIDDLTRRAYVVLAAISPDGLRAAYLVARADPEKNAYEMTVTLVDPESRSSRTLSMFTLGGSEAFGVGWFRDSAGSLYWPSSQELLYTERANGETRLVRWDVRTAEKRVLVSGHDEIILEESDRVRNPLRFVTRDRISDVGSVAGTIEDRAWRVEDLDFSYAGRAANPSSAPWERQQMWTLSTAGSTKDFLITPGESTIRRATPEWFRAREMPWADESTRAIHAGTYSNVVSPNGGRVAYVHLPDVLREGRTDDFAIGTAHGAESRILVHGMPDAAAVLTPRTVLGWASERGPVRYLEVDQHGSKVLSVTLEGQVRRIAQDPALLEKPCERLPIRRRCQTVSGDGRFGLLIRASNHVPDELLRIDLSAGTIATLADPNEVFRHRRHPNVQLHEADDRDGQASGRLYVPDPGSFKPPHPLVITQYHSNPGFYASTGDEIPILPLVSAGIAVFAMNSLAFNELATQGELGKEIQRVQRPLDHMEKLIARLASEGTVDPERVGLSGLSYGSEIALYGYWRSKRFAAVSVAAGSWEPATLALYGPQLAREFLARGFPDLSAPGAIGEWQRLAAGLNASPTLPPLLVQSAEGERLNTLPSWTSLRLAAAPVEWYEYPEAETGHVKWQPASKWWVYTRNYDWFRFWLQGYEDPAAEKAGQYERWRKLKRQREESGACGLCDRKRKLFCDVSHPCMNVRPDQRTNAVRH